jgi:hypothetical protein
MFQTKQIYMAEDEQGGGGGTATVTEAPSPAAREVPHVPKAAEVVSDEGTPAAKTAEAVKTETPPEPKDKPGIWPENWRQSVAKEDVKVLQRLERYASPEAALQALIAAQNRISAGELKPALGKNPTADQLKEWRESHGIPETPDKYEIPKGFQIPDEEKDLYAGLLKRLHDTNHTKEQVASSFDAMRQLSLAQAERRAEADAARQQEAEDTLRAEWGTEYRRNINLINGMLDLTTDKQTKLDWLEGRLKTGEIIGSSPNVLRMLVSLARIQNPTGTVVPGAENQMDGIDGEIAKIEKVMKENRGAYNKDTKMQDRLRELYGAREVINARNKR